MRTEFDPLHGRGGPDHNVVVRVGRCLLLHAASKLERRSVSTESEEVRSDGLDGQCLAARTRNSCR
jgi:hypothetical protein